MRCAIIYLQAFDDMHNISTMSPTQRVYHEKSNESQLIALILRTLPLSGRQGALGFETGRWWRPVHSRGLLEGIPRIAISVASPHRIVVRLRWGVQRTPQVAA